METNTPVSALLEHKGSQVHNVSPDASVLDAVQLMNLMRIGALLVMENGVPVGIFTERDILVRVVDARLDPANARVREIMSADLVVIKPGVTVQEAMRVMTGKRHRHLPVVEDGKLLGLISIGDLMRWMVREQDSYVENLLVYIYGQSAG